MYRHTADGGQLSNKLLCKLPKSTNFVALPNLLTRIPSSRYFLPSLKVRAVHTTGDSGNWFPLGHRYVCFNPTCQAVQKAVARKVNLAVPAAARVIGGAGSGDGVGASSGTRSVTGGAVSGTGVAVGTGDACGVVGASSGIGEVRRRLRPKTASSDWKHVLAGLSEQELSALRNGDLSHADPSFLKRLLDGAASFLFTDRR